MRKCLFGNFFERDDAAALLSHPARVCRTFLRIGDLLGQFSAGEFASNLFQVFAACEMRSIPQNASVASLSALDNELASKQFCLIQEGEVKQRFSASLQNIRDLRDASCSPVASSSSSGGISASVRSSLAEYAARNSSFISMVMEANPMDDAAVCALLSHAVQLNHKAIRLALAGDSKVISAIPAYGALNGLAKACFVKTLAAALFQDTLFSSIAKDRFMERLSVESVLRFFSASFPETSLLLSIFRLFREVTISQPSPMSLDELVVDTALFSTFISFSLTFFRVVGLNASALGALSASHSQFGQVLAAVRSSEQASVRVNMLSKSMDLSLRRLKDDLMAYYGNVSSWHQPPPGFIVDSKRSESAMDAIGLRNTFDVLLAHGFNPFGSVGSGSAMNTSLSVSGRSSPSPPLAFGASRVSPGTRVMEVEGSSEGGVNKRASTTVGGQGKRTAFANGSPSQGDRPVTRYSLPSSEPELSFEEAKELFNTRRDRVPFEIQGDLIRMGSETFSISTLRPIFETEYPGCRVDFKVLCSNAQTMRMLSTKMPEDTSEQEFLAWKRWWLGDSRDRARCGPDFA